MSAGAVTAVGRQVACSRGRGGELHGVSWSWVLKEEPVIRAVTWGGGHTTGGAVEQGRGRSPLQ